MSLDASLNFRCESALVWRLDRLSRVLRADVPDLMRRALEEYATAEEQHLGLSYLDPQTVSRVVHLLRELEKPRPAGERLELNRELNALLEHDATVALEHKRRILLEVLSSSHSTPKERVEARADLAELDRADAMMVAEHHAAPTTPARPPAHPTRYTKQPPPKRKAS